MSVNELTILAQALVYTPNSSGGLLLRQRFPEEVNGGSEQPEQRFLPGSDFRTETRGQQTEGGGEAWRLDVERSWHTSSCAFEVGGQGQGGGQVAVHFEPRLLQLTSRTESGTRQLSFSINNDICLGVRVYSELYL